MFETLIDAVRTMLDGMVDPLTNGIVNRIFDFILEVFNMFGA